jgi:hypothetical protein
MYTELGGFHNLAHGEDRDLYHRAMAAGFRIRHDPHAVVTTSSRRRGRAPRGFAEVLHLTEQQEREGSGTAAESLDSLVAR